MLKREADTISKINNSNFSDEYKTKLLEAYYDFKENGFELKMHSLNRFLGQKEGKGKWTFTREDLLGVLARPSNYIQENDGNYVKFYDGIAVIEDSNTRAVISIVVRNKERDDWRVTQ